MRSPLRLLLVFVAVWAAPVAAQSPRANLVVSPEWLAKHVRDPNIVLLQVGEKPEYDKSHIPGARFVDFHDIAVMQDSATKLTLQLPSDDTLRVRLARLGISDNSRIIVYWGNDKVSWVTPSTRVVLTLDHAGFGDATSILDGGLPAWIRAGSPVTADTSPARSGTISRARSKQVTVTAEFVRDNIGKPGFAVVDGRASVFYDGVQEGGPSDARKKGHVAGALSVPFTAITNDDNTLKTTDELATIFKTAGVKPGDTIIGYCHIGQQATAMLFAARTLGYKIFLYDGSFEDWARRGWPVEGGK